jgi:hypothetical protein
MGKQLNIKSDRAYQLASELAAAEGVGLTEIVVKALVAMKTGRNLPPSPEEIARRGAMWDLLTQEDAQAWRDSGLRYDSDKALYDEDGIPK